MINLYRFENLGKMDLGWLHSSFHFSFADYHNEKRMNFGRLRVLNHDILEPGEGVATHPHRNMEIITYVINGEISHLDSMNNKRVVKRGSMQYISAGTGITHSEYNYGDIPLVICQIWILPDEKNVTPNYGDLNCPWDLRVNKLYHMVGSLHSDAPIKIHQDMNIYSLYLEEGKSINFQVASDRQVYLVNLEGSLDVNTTQLNYGDGIEVRDENLEISTKTYAHMLILEMKKE